MASTIPSSGPSITTIVLATVGTLTAATLGYAIYFDQRRRSDPEFRRQIKRARRQVQESAAAAENERKDRLREMVAECNRSVTSPEDTEAVFMEMIATGENMLKEGADPTQTALKFYKALKVYPQPSELIGIFDTTLSTEVREIIAEMISLDTGFDPTGRKGSVGAETVGSQVE